MIGQQVGHYEIVGTLGSGGMGVVYLARDLRLDRLVAMKLLSEGRVADEPSRARLRREAQALSRLNHPNIATLYEFDTCDGRDFLVMEYIEGESLRDVGLDPLPPAEIIRLGTQLSDALVAAHGAGVVHLDLKPGNLIRTVDGRLKVLDFGIARLHAVQPPDDVTQTASEDSETAPSSAGTPPYMAPEQVASGDVDGRTDVYGAGATLYELATGYRVFTEPRGPALFEAILRTPPARPSTLNPKIGAPLEATLLKALEKDPGRRPQPAQELLADFQQCLTGRSPAPPIRRWTRREMMVTAAGSLAVVAATGYALRPLAAPARFRARDFVLVGDFNNATGDTLLSRTVQQALTIALQQSQYVNVVSRERVVDTLRRMQRDISSPVDEATAIDICRREAIPALITGGVARSGGTTQITIKVLAAADGAVLFAEMAEYTKPDQLFSRVDRLAAKVRSGFGESESGIAQFSQPLAKVTTISIEALQQYSKAVEARAMSDTGAVEGPLLAALMLDKDFAMAHLKLGDFYMEVAGDDRRALVMIDNAYRLRNNVTERERLFISAQYFSAHQRFEEARDSLKALCAMYPDDPDFHYELAIAHYSLEHLPAAASELRQTVRLYPHGARAHGSLVLLLARNNQPDAALDALDAAHQLGVDSPYLYWAAGLARLAKGDFARAHADFDVLTRGVDYDQRLGQLQRGKAFLLEGRFDEGVTALLQLVEQAHRADDVNIETVARLQVGHALAVQRDAAGARHQAAAAAALVAAGDSRPNLLRDVGVLAYLAGDRALLAQQTARLAQAEATAGTRLAQAGRLLLDGLGHLQSARYAAAVERFTASYALRPWYECRLYQANAFEQADESSAATESWGDVLKARGQIIQDGFPSDLRLAETRLAQVEAGARKD
jgi:TolB-like protein